MFEGSMVAIVTPFNKGRVDKVALKKLLDFQIEAGTDVIVPCGTTGEAATMTHDEHKRVLSFVRDYVGDKAKVICGAGSNNTEEALSLIKHAKKIKADGVLVVVPYYNKPTQDGLYKHFSYLAKSVDIPMVLYNVPSRTGIAIDMQTVVKLSKISNIVAIKEASGNMDNVSYLISETKLDILSGDDALTFPMMALGAKGVISVAANIIPDKMKAMTDAALNGDWDTARKIHFDIYPINKVLFIETNPIPVKTALYLMKKIKAEFRLPLCGMLRQNYEKLRIVLKAKGLI